MNLPPDDTDARSPACLRLASLVPSLTELLCAMNLGSRLVARTGYCVHPRSEVKAVPKVGGTKTVNLAKLRRLAPTHVLVNVDENRLETVEALRTFVPNVLVTHPCGPKDLDDMIRELARVFRGQPGVARAARRLRQEIAESLAATRPDGRPPRRVLYLVWRDPWMTVARDTWISRLLARVGWHSWPDIEGGPVGAARRASGAPSRDGARPRQRRPPRARSPTRENPAA